VKRHTGFLVFVLLFAFGASEGLPSNRGSMLDKV
jgi:hypothetical protein